MARGYRTITVGKLKFEVPPYIQRIDIVRDMGFTSKGAQRKPARTHGWQVRLGKPFVMFSDYDLGPVSSFGCALQELAKRLKATPPKKPTSVRLLPLSTKQDDLPAGVYGPFERRRPGRAPYGCFHVSLPRRDGPNKMASVYIGTPSTWSDARVKKALARATQMRSDAVIACGKLSL